MRGTELQRGFVLQSEDSYISSNRPCWAFGRKEAKSNRQEIVLGRHNKSWKFTSKKSKLFVFVESDPKRSRFWCVAKA